MCLSFSNSTLNIQNRQTFVSVSFFDQDWLQEFQPLQAAMVYGFFDCEYCDVKICLQDLSVRVFEQLGESEEHRREVAADCPIPMPIESHVMENGREIAFIPGSGGNSYTAALVNMIFENYYRSVLGLSLLPILFCIDIDHNSHNLPTGELIAVRGIPSTRGHPIVTVSELRRAYRLCYEENLPERFRAIARRSLVFVKVHPCTCVWGNGYHLEQIPAPWDPPQLQAFTQAWQQAGRRDVSKSRENPKSWITAVRQACEKCSASS
jgi:hypothetical protein